MDVVHDPVHTSGILSAVDSDPGAVIHAHYQIR